MKSQKKRKKETRNQIQLQVRVELIVFGISAHKLSKFSSHDIVVFLVWFIDLNKDGRRASASSLCTKMKTKHPGYDSSVEV